MKNKVIIIGLSILTVLAIIMGVVLLNKNISLSKNKITIIDATYKCSNGLEKIYEDDKYIYSYPCHKSNSVFVKFPDNTKILVTAALSEEKVTIDELINAGLDVIKNKK